MTDHPTLRRMIGPAGWAIMCMACAATPVQSPSSVPTPTNVADSVAPGEVHQAASDRTRTPVMPPRAAMLAGLLPLGSIGIDTFRLRYPEYDGRNVIIGILDSGVDVGVPGLRETTTGRPKILDVRDFSGEGRIPLTQLRVGGADTIVVEGQRLAGFGRVARMASSPYFVGVLREWAFGNGEAADLNGNGRDDDTFALIVAKASSGWVVFTDTDGDGRLDNETPVHDFAVRGDMFAYRSDPALRTGPFTLVANVSDENGQPRLTLIFDNASHGTHVAGIAAGHDMFGIEGFDGVAPGAHILALKISDNSRGAVSVTGSMVRAMNYAADYAEARNLPLVLNLSFGVGNEIEGSAAIDSIINDFALRYPNVVFVISAGNDGPGLSSVWFPGSAEFALSVCALFPGAFAEPADAGFQQADDLVGWWSARGGELAKPDLCAPGVAFSNVPPWQTGEEISIGTSMAAPQIAGAAAMLQSAMLARGLRPRAIDVGRALMNTARSPEGATRLDVGSGIPDVTAAYQWLLAAHQAGVYSIRALPMGGNTSRGTAAFRRDGLQSRADTMQEFTVTSVSGQPAARLVLDADAEWIRTPDAISLRGEPVTVMVTYDASKLREPGLYVGSVIARPASDTLAGPSFALINTVVVPHSLDTPFYARGELGAGAIRRFFFRVPDGAGGLTARLTVGPADETGTLYLFEPSGRPYRDESQVAVGGVEPSTGALQLSAEDLIPGVYELVVTAPPSRPLEFELTVSVPEVAVVAIGAGPRTFIRNTTNQSVTATVSAAALGWVRSFTVHGGGSSPEVLSVRPPSWAREMVVDVQLPPEYWHLMSDFGLTVFNPQSRKLSDGSLRYAFHRHRVPIDSIQADRDLTIELLPAYAHTTAAPQWSARVRVAFLLDRPIPLGSVDGEASAEVRLLAGATEGVQLAEIPAAILGMADYETLVEVVAQTSSGPSVRRGPAGTQTSDAQAHP